MPITIAKVAAKLQDAQDANKIEAVEVLYELLIDSTSTIQSKIYTMVDSRPDITTLEICNELGRGNNYIGKELLELEKMGLVQTVRDKKPYKWRSTKNVIPPNDLTYSRK